MGTPMRYVIAMCSRIISALTVRKALAGLVFAALLTGCGGSSASPTATPSPRPTARTAGLKDGRAVATARTFLHAFTRRDKSTMLRLMSTRLRNRNRHEFVADMLHAPTSPRKVTVVRSQTYRARTGTWTRVIARLTMRGRTVTDELAIVKIRGRYRVNTIRFVRAS